MAEGQRYRIRAFLKYFTERMLTKDAYSDLVLPHEMQFFDVDGEGVVITAVKNQKEMTTS